MIELHRRLEGSIQQNAKLKGKLEQSAQPPSSYISSNFGKTQTIHQVSWQMEKFQKLFWLSIPVLLGNHIYSEGVPRSWFLLFQYRNNPAVTVAFSVQTFSWLPIISSGGVGRAVALCRQSGANGRKGRDPGKGRFWFLSTSISSQLRYLVFFFCSCLEDHLIFPFQKARFSNAITKKTAQESADNVMTLSRGSFI